MKPRLARPLYAVAVAGALFASGMAVANPASAAPVDPALVAAAENPADGDPTPEPTTPEPSAPVETPPVSPSASASESAEPTPTPTETVSTPAETPSPTETVSTPAETPSSSTPPTAPTPPVDTTAPTGAFKVNASALWIGQRVELSPVNIADNGVQNPASVTRVVAWGDGTAATTLTTASTKVKHQYSKVGSFTIRLTLTDAAGNRTVKSHVIKVTKPGKVKLSKTSVWHGERFNVIFSSVPAGTTRIALNYGDGFSAILQGRNQTIRSVYDLNRAGNFLPAGKYTLKAMYRNRLGDSAAFPVGTVTLKKDSWAPKVKITKPAKSNRVSSWKTLRGTASDKGSGLLPRVWLGISRLSGNKAYCYTSGKTWARLYEDRPIPRSCLDLSVPLVKGKWSLPIKGLKKGYIWIGAQVRDQSGQWSSVAEINQLKLTR